MLLANDGRVDNCTGTRSRSFSRAVSAVTIADKGRFGTVLESRIIETLISYKPWHGGKY